MKRLSLPTLLLLCALAPAATAQDTPASSTEPAEASDKQATEAAETDESAENDDGFETIPDRPTFSAAAAAVAAGHAQVELGGEFSTNSGASQLAFPVLVRVGIAEAFELRAGLPSFIIPLQEDTDSELGSLQLGAKVAGNVTDSISLGALPFFDIATAAGDETTFSQSTYGFLMLWGLGFTDAFGIGGNLGASVGPGSTEEAGPRELFYALSLTASLAVDDLGITAEGFTVLGQYADPEIGASLSLGYAILDKLVVDLYGGSREQSGDAGFFVGAGVTVAR